jgi:hypothetical protein
LRRSGNPVQGQLKRAIKPVFTRSSTAREVLLGGDSLSPEDRVVKEERFFQRIRLQNGLFKVTAAHRLDDVNEVVLRYIQSRWSAETLQVLDVGVSSGITTIELAEALQRSGRKFKIVGTDLCIEASFLSYGWHLNVLLDQQGRPLQFELLGFPISNYFGARVSMWIRRTIPVLFARFLFKVLASPVARRLIGPPYQKPVRLLTGRWRDYPEVEFVQEDLFAEVPNRFQYHLIRAANILNHRLFSNAQLRRAIDLLRVRLKVGGLLLVVRTQEDGSNHGACYELLPDSSLRNVLSLGRGCEVDSVILGAGPNPGP